MLRRTLEGAVHAVSSFLVSPIDLGEDCYALPGKCLDARELDP